MIYLKVGSGTTQLPSVPLESCPRTCQQCHDMKEINEQITAAQRTLQALFEQHRQLREEHNEHYDILLRRLPPELLETIFRLCLPGKDTWGVTDVREVRKTRMPLLLGWVCRGWRDLAWCSPLLWDTISLQLDSRNPLVEELIFLGWLSRSKAVPLSVTVTHLSTIPSQAMFRRNTVVGPLNEESHRWRSLSVELPSAWYRYFAGKRGLHHLESLQVKLSPNYTSREELQFDVPQGTPRLCRLSGVRVPLRQIKVSWGRLTEANITDLSEDDVVALLTEASQLVLLKVAHLHTQGTLQTQAPPIMHRTLKSITIKGYCTLLNRLTPPLLRTYSGDNCKVVREQLTALVLRSSCSLKTIRMTLGKSSPLLPVDVRLHCLSAFPTVSQLVLDGNVDEKFFEMISTRSTTAITGQPQTSFLPKLAYLQVVFSNGADIPWARIPNLFEHDDEHAANGRQRLISVKFRPAVSLRGLRDLMDETTARLLWDYRNRNEPKRMFIIGSVDHPDKDLLAVYINSRIQRRDRMVTASSR